MKMVNLMMRFKRTEMIIGKSSLERLKESKIIVFGIGGVGGYLVEALARCGIKNITLVDNDIVSETNINRQIIALSSTIGKYKTEVMKERILDINPEANVNTYNIFYDLNNKIELEGYDYIIDCIDTVTSKILLIMEAKEKDIPIISSMGTGNKLNPSLLKITDISKTSVCPLARVMRYELRKRGINHLKVLYSNEEPKGNVINEKRNIPGSISFLPSTAGLLIASEVVKDIINKEE